MDTQWRCCQACRCTPQNFLRCTSYSILFSHYFSICDLTANCTVTGLHQLNDFEQTACHAIPVLHLLLTRQLRVTICTSLQRVQHSLLAACLSLRAQYPEPCFLTAGRSGNTHPCWGIPKPPVGTAFIEPDNLVLLKLVSSAILALSQETSRPFDKLHTMQRNRQPSSPALF